MKLVGPLLLVAGCTVGEGLAPDAGEAIDPDAELATGTAPPGAVVGEVPGAATNDVDVPPGDVAIYRFETTPGEHLAFRLDFAPSLAGAVLAVDRWDGAAPGFLGETDAGAGLRVLSVVDQDGPRTFWVRLEARGADAITGTLSATRTPFVDGPTCDDDCARLLQLPLPNDVARDGYDISHAVYRYQFGRRDLVMFLREAGRRMAAAGHAAFQPEDLSQWNGETPGADVGDERHASHKRGLDVDLSLYGTDGGAQWRSFCTVMNDGSGRECVDGTRSALFDGATNAMMIGVFAETGRMTMGFLDQELIPALDPAQPLIQHWPNHDNHVHVRVAEDGAAAVFSPP